MLAGSHVHLDKMPWELTPALQAISSVDTTAWLRLPKIPRSLPAVDVVGPGRPMDDDKTTVSKICHGIPGHAARRSDTQRSQALLKWAELVLACPSHSTVGQQMLVAQRTGHSEDYVSPSWLIVCNRKLLLLLACGQHRWLNGMMTITQTKSICPFKRKEFMSISAIYD